MALRLPRLPRNVRLIDGNGFPTAAFQQWWQAFAVGIEGELGALEAADAATAAAVAANAAASAANAAAVSANGAAVVAQGAADDAANANAIANSGVTGATITATDVGPDVTVSITAHTRVYGDNVSVSVNAGSVTALAYSTTYFIYYDQASRAGGAVTYQVTTVEANAAQLGDRHLVGRVLTPAALAGPETGDYVGLAGIGSLLI